MPFKPETLDLVRPLFEAIVAGEPKRALALDPVIRWQLSAWIAFEDTIFATGFEISNPEHLAALQYLIDTACDL